MIRPSLGRVILTYVTAGPLTGLVGLIVFLAVYQTVTGGPMQLGDPAGWLFVVAFAYIFGALPAMITGVAVAAMLKRNWSLLTRLAAAAIVGAVMSCAALFWIILGPNGDLPKWAVVAMVVFIGALAAVVGTLVLERWPGHETG